MNQSSMRRSTRLDGGDRGRAAGAGSTHLAEKLAELLHVATAEASKGRVEAGKLGDHVLKAPGDALSRDHVGVGRDGRLDLGVLERDDVVALEDVDLLNARDLHANATGPSCRA